MTAHRIFRPWRTLKLGTHKSAEGLRESLVKGGFRINSWAAHILKTITLAPAETEIELVNVLVHDLCFGAGAVRAQIYNRAKEFGLGLIAAEAGPQLRLQYADQPMGESLIIAMEPIVDHFDGKPRIFFVACLGDGRWLHALYASPDRFWAPDVAWVFARKQ